MQKLVSKVKDQYHFLVFARDRAAHHRGTLLALSFRAPGSTPMLAGPSFREGKPGARQDDLRRGMGTC